MKKEFDTFDLVLRMRSMVYSLKDFESLWFLYQAEGLPKNISIEEFCTKHGVDYPTFDKWYRKTHKKVYPVTVMGMPTSDGEVQREADKVSELGTMEKDQLISMIHFLVKRDEDRAQENKELKDMVKELTDAHKMDMKT